MTNLIPMAAVAGVSGLASSFGPCVAPRFMAIVGLSGPGSKGVALRVTAFVAGLGCSLVLVGLAGGAVSWLAAQSSLLYASVSAVAFAVGLFTMLRPCARAVCAQTSRETGSRVPAGAAALAGVAMSGIASPCCGPLALAVSSIPFASGDRWAAIAVLSAFAVGHVAPLLVFAKWWLAVARFVEARVSADAMATVSGALAIGLGAYYACLS